ncbi:MAG: STAS domain-containing protein [Waddliaceae bacterium]
MPLPHLLLSVFQEIESNGDAGSMAGLIEIQHDARETILLLRIKGRLDHVTVPQVDRQLLGYIEKWGNASILIDFSGVSYLSIAGLHLLLDLHKKVKAKSGYLAIFSINHQTANVLKITNSDAILNVCKTEEEAFQCCK